MGSAAGRRRRPRRSRCPAVRGARRRRSRRRSPRRSRGRRRAPGCPTVTPQVASGSPMRRGVVQCQHRLQAGEAGRDQLRAAAEAGEEVRLDEAGGDAHVGVDPLPVQPDRARRRPSLPDPAQAVLVAGVVVDHPDPVEHVSAPSMASQLGVRVAAVGAGGHEQHDVLGPDEAVQLVEQRPGSSPAGAAAGCRRTSRWRPSARAGPGRAAAAPAVGARSAARTAACRVGHGGGGPGGHHEGPLRREVDGQAGLAVGEPYQHCRPPSRPVGRSRYTRVAVPPKTAPPPPGRGRR